jgi:non-haem Fe2+, alpha-ketoglutarate-dependent halogenase
MRLTVVPTLRVPSKRDGRDLSRGPGCSGRRGVRKNPDPLKFHSVPALFFEVQRFTFACVSTNPKAFAMPTASAPSRHRLSEEQKKFYRENGYLLGLPPIYTREEMAKLNAELPNLLALLEPGESTKDIREWHETSTYLYEICMNPKILDLVEGVLGPNFFMWASNFFIKEPRSLSTVGWHQDAYYWPMTPHNSVTVWLAFDDVGPDNGGMKLLPGSHRGGIIKHRRSTQTSSVLTLELEDGTDFNADNAVQWVLKAGECSLHDDRAIHGSPANPSDRRRAGLTIRYSGTNVKNDLSVNPHFKAYLCRGVDEYRHNPVGTLPTQRYGRPAFKPVSNEEAGKA